MVEFKNVTFKYQGQDGKQITRTLKIEQGVVIDFKNENGDYINSYTINSEGKGVPLFGSKKPEDVIELTESQIEDLLRIQKNDKAEGLSKRDFEIEDLKRVRSTVTEQTRQAGVNTWKNKHPILEKFLPDSFINWLVND